MFYDPILNSTTFSLNQTLPPLKIGHYPYMTILTKITIWTESMNYEFMNSAHRTIWTEFMNCNECLTELGVR